MAKESISHLMKLDHNRIHTHLSALEKSLGKEPQAIMNRLFKVFATELEKHFILEEQAIFGYLSDEDEETKEGLEKIAKQHKLLLNSLDDLKEITDLNQEEDLHILIEALRKHARFEDEIFYPLLDEKLDDKTKKMIAIQIATGTGHFAEGESL